MPSAFTPNQRTKNILTTLEKILKTARENDKRLIVSCGLAIEIEAAATRADDRLTRNHDDLDIHPLEKDLPFWRNWFEQRKYMITSNDEIVDDATGFVAHSPFSKQPWDDSPQAFYIDVYGVLIDDEGFMHFRQTGEDHISENPIDEVIVECRWRGNTVEILRHEVLLKQKRDTAAELGTELREKDLHDITLFEDQ